MESINCLTRALDQWNSNKMLFRLWYNSNHVISLEECYSGSDLIDYNNRAIKYLPFRDYGYNYFSKSFALNKKYKLILQEYLEFESTFFM